MKHTKYFDDFLKEHVNLNQSRLDTLNKRVDAVTTFLKSKLENYRKYSQQGSYAHRTIIKPVRDGDEFDADILVFINDDNFEPGIFLTDFITEVYQEFRDNGNYREIVRRKTRCATLDYAGEFHLDIVPCVEHKEEIYICNRHDKVYEKTDGDGYRNWLAEKNTIVGGNNLKKVTRLLKFLRDHKSNYSITSILLTTIVGQQIRDFEEDSSQFKDIPTALKTLSNRVNDFLQQNPQKPAIRNPVLPEEDFTRKWTMDKYLNFREKFDHYNEKINDAFDEKDHNESVKKWRKLFGGDFGELRTIDAVDNSTPKTIAASGIATASPSAYATKPYATSHD